MDGVTVLSFAKAYGFRNISTIVTKVKRGRCPYDFVEVMACPSGCVNGGGQVRALPADGATAATDAQARDLVVHVNVRQRVRCPTAVALLRRYRACCGPCRGCCTIARV